MDATEIASLRDRERNRHELGLVSGLAFHELESILDALEQAHEVRDGVVEELDLWTGIAGQRAGERDAAQNDAKDARALLGHAKHFVGYAMEPTSRAEIVTRIEDMLEKKI